MAILIVAASRVLPSILLPAYELVAKLRSGDSETFGAFHTSLERECLEILLRGSVPITIVPARTFDATKDRLYAQHPKLWKAVQTGMQDGRITIVAPPGVSGNRITRKNAGIRKPFLLDQADSILLLYANPSGETDRMVRDALTRGIPVSVLDHPANHHSLDLGATLWE